MSIAQKLKHEIVAVAWLTFYFGCWLGALVLLKYLVLAEYQIAFYGLSAALVGALVLAKVVLVLEHVSLGAWVRARPAWVDVVLRTALYSFGVFIVLLLEKAFEGRHEYDSFGASMIAVLQQADAIHVWHDMPVDGIAQLQHAVRHSQASWQRCIAADVHVAFAGRVRGKQSE